MLKKELEAMQKLMNQRGLSTALVTKQYKNIMKTTLKVETPEGVKYTIQAHNNSLLILRYNSQGIDHKITFYVTLKDTQGVALFAYLLNHNLVPRKGVCE